LYNVYGSTASHIPIQDLTEDIHENSRLGCFDERFLNLLKGLPHSILASDSSVVEQYHFYAAPAPAPGKNFDAAPAAPDLAAPAPAPAPTLLYSKAKF
jgi:hypothetical protein